MEQTTFLNIDLDIESDFDIAPIVASFGTDVSVLRNERFEGRYHGSFETGYGKPDDIIAEFSRLIGNLTDEAAAVWRQCSLRRLDLGLQSGPEPYAYHAILAPDTVRQLAALGTTLVITVYSYNPDHTPPT